MRTFKDNAGRTWNLTLNVWTVKKVRDLLGAVAAWADGQIGTAGLLAAVWAAAQAIFIRAGIANEVTKAQE